VRDDGLHSIVVPMYNEEPVAEEFLKRAGEALAALPAYELIIVDDGSSDSTFQILRRHAAADPRVKLIRFARNFGHQTAITAGIDIAAGETVTVIDADLQDPPELIPRMVEEWRGGADIVFAVRRSREGETLFKRSTASAFYRLLNKIGDIDAPLDAGDFRLMSRRAVEALAAMRETSRYVRGMVGWVGMRRACIEYARDARFAGVTKYPLRKMIRLAANGLVSFSKRPLQMAIWLGVATSGLGFAIAVYAVVKTLTGGEVVQGWPSTLTAILLVGGVQLIMLGVVGEYVGRIYDEVRRRPLYLVSEAIGFPADVEEHFAGSPLPRR